MAKQPTKNGHAKAKADEKPLVAYFLSLELENVRCFGERVKLDLSDGNGKPAQWTVILGVNGVGKTTLLHAIVGSELEYDMLKSGDIDLFPRIFMRNVWEDFIGVRSDKKVTIIHMRYSTSTQLSEHSFNDIECKMIFGDTTASQIGPGPPNKTLDQLVFVAYGAGRRVGELSFLEPSPDDDPTGTLFSDNAKLRNPEEWLLFLDYTSSTEYSNDTKRDLQRSRRELAVDLLKQVLWEIDDIRFNPGEGFRPKPHVEMKTPYGWVPFRQLGYGYQSLATWVADFASRMVERYPESKNPLAEPAICLVDEIDLHLHPKWQRDLMSRLSAIFPNTQFIATAHSPLIVQACENANLAVLRRKGDYVIIDKDVDYIRNWRVDQILTSDLFGLDSARPPHIAKKLAERDEILAKSRLTKADEKRLKALEAEIGELPTHETTQDRHEMETIRKNLDALIRKEGLIPK